MQIRKLEEKWKRLHEERQWIEGGLIPTAKAKHLAFPDHYIEIDEDGLPFEREQLFVRRVGPPPGLVDEALARQWSMVELSSLCDGLKQYSGPFVFEKVFRRYCGKGRELNKYNVTEIVTVAAALREQLTLDQESKYGEVEEWIAAIPVWTRAHALGKENEDHGIFVE